MGENSKIEWTDNTFNPWIGCTKVSPGCAECYAETLMDKRYGRVKWGPQGTRERTSESNWKQPLKWQRQAEREGRRFRVFCASLADVFEDNPQVADWRSDLWDLIELTPSLDWLLLTKRPENIRRFTKRWDTLEQLPANIWIGTSVENQEQAEKRIPELLRIPAAVRFLSCEPLLGPIDFDNVIPGGISAVDGPYVPGIHWVIAGGESGPNARPMRPDWARSLRDQCKAAGVPFFFKQWGEWIPYECGEGYVWKAQNGEIFSQDGETFQDKGIKLYNNKLGFRKIGKHAAGSLLDGVEHKEFPN